METAVAVVAVATLFALFGVANVSRRSGPCAHGACRQDGESCGACPDAPRRPSAPERDR